MKAGGSSNLIKKLSSNGTTKLNVSNHAMLQKALKMNLNMVSNTRNSGQSMIGGTGTTKSSYNTVNMLMKDNNRFVPVITMSGGEQIGQLERIGQLETIGPLVLNQSQNNMTLFKKPEELINMNKSRGNNLVDIYKTITKNENIANIIDALNNIKDKDFFSKIALFEPTLEQKQLLARVLIKQPQHVKELLEKARWLENHKKEQQGGNQMETEIVQDYIFENLDVDDDELTEAQNEIRELMTIARQPPVPPPKRTSSNMSIFWCILGTLFFSTIFSYMGMFGVMSTLINHTPTVTKPPRKQNIEEFVSFTLELEHFVVGEAKTNITINLDNLNYTPVNITSIPTESGRNMIHFLQNPSVFLKYVLPRLDITNLVIKEIDNTGAYPPTTIDTVFKTVYDKLLTNYTQYAHDDTEKYSTINPSNATIAATWSTDIFKLFNTSPISETTTKPYDDVVWAYLNKIATKMNTEIANIETYNMEVLDRLKQILIDFTLKEKLDQRYVVKMFDMINTDMNNNESMRLTEKVSKLQECFLDVTSVTKIEKEKLKNCVIANGLFVNEELNTLEKLNSFLKNKNILDNIGLGYKSGFTPENQKNVFSPIIDLLIKQIPAIDGHVATKGMSKLLRVIRTKTLFGLSTIKMKSTEQIAAEHYQFSLASTAVERVATVIPTVIPIDQIMNAMSVVAAGATTTPFTGILSQAVISSGKAIYNKFKIKQNKSLENILIKMKEVYEFEIKKNKGIIPTTVEDTLNQFTVDTYKAIAGVQTGRSYNEETIELLSKVIDTIYIRPITENVEYSFMVGIIDIILSFSDNIVENNVEFTQVQLSDFFMKSAFLVLKYGTEKEGTPDIGMFSALAPSPSQSGGKITNKNRNRNKNKK
jgi:hypothetical protein